MLICIFATRILNHMADELVPGEARIDEEHVASAAPGVRALVVQRLEQVWRACEPHILATQQDIEDGFRRDPRYIDAGMKVLDRLSGIYGLLKPHQTQADPDTGSSQDQRLAVAKLVAELEERLPKQ